jgi:chromosome segregation ATPase
MGLLVTLTELLGRLTVLTPLLERYLAGNRNAAGTQHLQESLSNLNSAQTELSSTLQSNLEGQQTRLAKIEETVARVANRLAELVNDRDRLEVEFHKVKSLLRLVLAVSLVSMAAALAAIALLILRIR